jgi:hypothetical protein
MTEYTRRYPSGSSDFYPNGTTLQVSYVVAGTDGSSIEGTLDTHGLLTEDQIDELAFAIQTACSGLPWLSTSFVTVLEDGRRAFSVSPVTPPQ